MTALTPFVLPLAVADSSLEIIGGKGHALAKLAVAGMPVPAGFVVSTHAYRQYLEINALQGAIRGLAASVGAADPASFEQASAAIGSLFQAAPVPAEVAGVIARAYAGLAGAEGAVAVRSSATAEDLPDLSFAGQQDTFLNVRGAHAVLAAVRNCWASLWSERAMRYRQRMGVNQHDVAMAVVVQLLLDADVSGVLFTANPASGERSQFIVNASFGLGEAVVGGHVTPDTFVLDRHTSQIRETVIGAKQQTISAREGQGTVARPVPGNLRGQPCIEAEKLAELAALSTSVETLFKGVPQDIEWAIADNVCWLLQSRPITNLPPQPLRDVSWDPPSKKAILVRRQVVENMPEPLSPLFAQLYLEEGLEASIDLLLSEIGFMDFAEFIERPLFVTVNGYGYARYEFHFAWRQLRLVPKLVYAYVRAIPRILGNVVGRWRDKGLAPYRTVIDQYKAIDLEIVSDEQLLQGVRVLASADAAYWFQVSLVLAMAKVTDAALHRFLGSRLVPGDLTSGMFLSGFPSGTLQAQQDLEAIAAIVRQDKTLTGLVTAASAEDLLEVLRDASGGPPIVAELRRYLDTYGHQIYNLDFAVPTQAEDPLPVLLSFRLLVAEASRSTQSRQQELARARADRVLETSRLLGPVRRWLFRKLLAWAHRYGPYREEALFYMGAGWPALRRLALELGGRFVRSGYLCASDDVFYLRSEDIEQACKARAQGGECLDLAVQADRERALRSARKQLHPPGRVPEDFRLKLGPFDFTDMAAVWETQKHNADDSNTLEGFAVSPGRVTGIASVILSPADFARMKPDSILVCRTTTPAWTPLFAQATGLVTDVGAILAHGSIVAREYGIPAVLGTGNATRRIVSGQRIAIDGDAGTVTLL